VLSSAQAESPWLRSQPTACSQTAIRVYLCGPFSVPTGSSLASSHVTFPNTRTVRAGESFTKPVNATDELFPADLLDAKATAAAVAGGEVTYLVAV
jgi:hypothetical protein